MTSPSGRDPLRYFAWPAYATALFIILAVAVDLAQGLWPFSPTQAAWRYGAAGFLSGSLVTPSLAALLALGTSIYFGHVRVQSFLAGLAGVICIALIATAGMFALDSIVVGSQTQPNAQNTLLIAQMRALTKLGLGVVVSWIYAVAAFRSARELKREDRRARSSSDMLVSASAPPATGKPGAS